MSPAYHSFVDGGSNGNDIPKLVGKVVLVDDDSGTPRSSRLVGHHRRDRTSAFIWKSHTDGLISLPALDTAGSAGCPQG
jgi:hypothetical protein